MTDAPAFAAPGPGRWDLDRSHYPGGTTPISQWLMGACPVAMRRAFAELGMPGDTLDVRFVNGFMYSRLRPLIRPDQPAAKLPPLPVLRVATRLHRGMRARAATAEAQLRERPWRAVVTAWTSTTRPRLEARNRALQAVDLAGLDDAALAAHAGEVLAWCRETFEQHFYLHAFDLGPIGMLLYDAERWGVPAAAILPALGGASPSTSGPAAVLGALRAEVEAAGVVPTTLDDVRSASPAAARLLDEYLERRGTMMVTRYDLDGHTLNERPDTVVASIVHAPTGPVDHGHAQEAARAARELVPEAHRDDFDDRLREARAAMDLRDDNGPYTVEWPVGLLRRALREVGRRAVAAGRLTAPEHAFELEPHEVVPFARGAALEPTGPVLAERAAARARDAALVPPPSLGPAEAAPPLSVLAPAHQVLVGAVQQVLEHLGMTARPAGEDAAAALTGVGVGQLAYTGRARLAADPEAALDGMDPGDVLVVRFTTPAYNTVLSLAGAVVTVDGGPLCHAAVMARELGIPAVIGAPGALDLIVDGATVEVDPLAGRVRIVG